MNFNASDLGKLGIGIKMIPYQRCQLTMVIHHDHYSGANSYDWHNNHRQGYLKLTTQAGAGVLLLYI
jgi:hypothetical protein